MAQPAVIDLEDGRAAVPIWLRRSNVDSDLPCGVLYVHPTGPSGDEQCRTFVCWAGPDQSVGLDSLHPLSVVGGFTCACGEDGTFTAGRWVRW